MKYVLHPSRVSNTTRHCYSFVVGLLFGLTCFGLVYVIRCYAPINILPRPLSPWGNILVSQARPLFLLLYWDGKKFSSRTNIKEEKAVWLARLAIYGVLKKIGLSFERKVCPWGGAFDLKFYQILI